MTYIIIIILLLLSADYFSLRRRVSKLEEQINSSQVEEEKSLPESLSPIPPPTDGYGNKNTSETSFPPMYEPEAFTPSTISSQSSEEKSESASELFIYTWFKEHTLIKIGGLFFFLGAAWFVSYAINAGWLSPEIRIAFGFLLAFSAYGLGVLRSREFTVQYLVLTAVGTGIMCATVSAAQIVFSMFPPLVALLILAISIAYTIFVAFLTEAKWLVSAAGAAGLLAPLLVGGVAESIWVFLYLLVLSTGLLLVGFRLDWRPITLLMALGVVFYESALMSTTSSSLLWFFVVIFSLLFFTSVTFALSRSEKPQAIDIVTLLVVGIGFVFFASSIALSDSIATFIATLVIAGTGYVLSQRNVPLSVVAVYFGFACAGLLIATSFLFSGFSLVLAYTVEVTAAFFIVTYLGLPERVIWIALATYLLPLLGSINSFSSSQWGEGIWHADALVLYTMTASLFASALWLMHDKTVSGYRFSKNIAGIFAVVGFFYTYIVIAVVTDAFFVRAESFVMMYLFWALLSLLYIYYALRRNLSQSTILTCALSLAIPVLVSTQSFSSPAWEMGIKHIEAVGVFVTLLILILVTILLAQQLYKDHNPLQKSLTGGFVFASVGYLFVTLYVVWQSLLEPQSLVMIATYTSYAIVLYGLTSLLVLLRASLSWVGWSLLALVIPVFLSLDSFSLTGWKAGVLAPEAVGLFGLLVIFVMLALGIRKRYECEDEAEQKSIKSWCSILIGLALVYTVLLTWSLTHTVLAKEQAVSLALFIYTIAGLLSYQYGKSANKKEYHYVGIVLLTFVVIRLVLVDIWEMALIWRVITFLGIGVLFIGTALLERPKTTEKVND